jgi:hypothetical protein
VVGNIFGFGYGVANLQSQLKMGYDYIVYNMLKILWGQTTHRFNVSETILLAIVPTSQQMLKVYHLCSQ